LSILAIHFTECCANADPDVDALDRDTPQDEDDPGGVYSAADLEIAKCFPRVVPVQERVPVKCTPGSIEASAARGRCLS
jgi:hypothetical protein